MGLFDAFNAQPGSAEALQLQGLLGGLTRMGGLLAQAGQFRPAGTPGPGIGDAFLGFGEGQRAGVQNAAQQAQMQQKMARQALIAKARSATPDDQLTTEEVAMRRALSGMPEDVLALAGPDELPGLAIDRAKGRQRPMTAEELAAANFRPGTAAFTSDWTGGVNVAQQSDIMSADRLKQDLMLRRASMQPQTTWKTIMGPDGQPIAQQSSLGEYRPLRQPSEGFTLGPGQVRFGPGGQQIAAGGPDKPNLPPGYQMVDGKAVPVPGLAEAQGAVEGPKRTAAAANDLRGEYTKLTADFRTVQDAFNKIEMAGKTGQGDMALLYGYMKILDPGSVVRESEFATAAKSGSFGEQMQGLVTKVLNGERLPDTVRDGFKAEARNVYQAQAQGLMKIQDIYGGLADRLGARREDVVLPFNMDGVGGARAGTPTARDPLGILK